MRRIVDRSPRPVSRCRKPVQVRYATLGAA